MTTRERLLDTIGQLQTRTLDRETDHGSDAVVRFVSTALGECERIIEHTHGTTAARVRYAQVEKHLARCDRMLAGEEGAP